MGTTAGHIFGSVAGIACLQPSLGCKCITCFGSMAGISLVLPSLMRACSCVLVCF
jgi:hypothetical protein